MLTSDYRLRKEADITRVLKTRKGVFDTTCGIKFSPNSLKNSRFAVVVSTKVSKNAVDRNRIRRQYQEILRAHLSKIAPGYDVLLMASKAAIDLEYSKKEERLIHVFKKAKLFR